MPTWRLAPALQKLLNQVNEAYPDRSRASDGTIGDAEHSGRKSDHNPDKYGIVNALDITHDPENGCDAFALAETLRRSKDPRIKYVIFAKRIFSSTVSPWIWRTYDGPNPHTKHVHISVGGDEVPWRIR